MKRAFLAFALVVTLVASLAACSSRPADNNGRTNNGTANNGSANSGTDIAPGDDAIIEDGIMDEGTTDAAIIGEDTIPPCDPPSQRPHRSGRRDEQCASWAIP